MLAGLKVKRLLLFSIVNKAVGIPDSSPLSLWMSTLGEEACSTNTIFLYHC
jgi:hypothetical protein